MRGALLHMQPIIRNARTSGKRGYSALALASSRPLQHAARSSAAAQRPSASNAAASPAAAASTPASAANPSPATATGSGSGNSGNGGDGGVPPSSGGAAAGGLPRWESVVRLSPADQAYLIGALPMFRHTCLGVGQATWSNSSSACAERLREDGMSGGAAWASTSTFGSMLLTLAMYVQVPTSLYDVIVGAREAQLLLVDCFNTFHLASSRARLRAVATPQVFRAVDSTWRLLDQMGLRMQYKVTVQRTLLLELNVHDSDEWERVGGPGKGGGGGGGGGGIAIPVDAPLGASPQGSGARPPSSSASTLRAQAPPSGPGAGSQAKAASTSGDKKPTDRAVRYVDLDVQYCLLETMELWSVRPDQTLNAEGDKAAADGDGAATTAGTPGAQATFVPSQGGADAAADDVVERMTSRIDAMYEAEKAARGKDGQSPAALEQQLRRMQDAVSGVDSSAASFTPLMSHGGVAAVAAGATSTATAATPSAAGAAGAAAGALPADGDWPAPLALLSTISGEGERGLRFYSDLPARQVETPGDGMLWAPSEFEDPTRGHPILSFLKKKAIEIMQVPANINKCPKANWIIKDILD